MRLLIITQKVDEQDQLLGFFIDWLNKFAKKFDYINILCLEKGEFTLPSNVKVISLGKDIGISKLGQLFNFYKNIWLLRKQYDAVFVFMNAIWIILGAGAWKLMNKNVFLWYAHKTITWKHKLANKFADGIFTSTPEGFRLKSDKIIIVGQGINTDLFRPASPKKAGDLSILSVGRIASIKNYKLLIGAIKTLKNQGTIFSVTIIGEPVFSKDTEYEKKLKDMIRDMNLENTISFLGKIIHKNLPAYYQSNHIYINLSDTGSLDKTILEAMACGSTVLSSNDAASKFLPKRLIIYSNDPEKIAKKIVSVKDLDFSKELREYVIQNHALNKLVEKISHNIMQKL